jgi:hypothetical protein
MHIHKGQNDKVSTESQKPFQVSALSAQQKKQPAFPIILEPLQETKDEYSDMEALLLFNQKFFHGEPVFDTVTDAH